MEAVTLNEPVFGNIPLHLVVASSTNPRKHFNETDLNELADSIRQHGVAQPILVRPIAGDENQVEIVAGERRYRASKLAGLETIPAIVRNLSDVQALEIQVIENLQRADLPAIEEAEGYEQLMKRHDYTAEQLAGKVGKSKAYIYGRLKLCTLTPSSREAFHNGKLTASTALLVARIPVASLQEQAVAEITHAKYKGMEPMSYRNAVSHIQSRYMLQLSAAPFSLTDAKLLKAAGACATCPKRTGNQPELFHDVDSADVCTDPDCFASKKAAGYEKLLAKAQKSGIPIIEAKTMYNLPDEAEDLVHDGSRLWDLERVKGDGKISIKEALQEEQLPKPKSYVKLPSGEVHALYDTCAIQQALEKAGLCATAEEHAALMAAEDSEGDEDDAMPQKSKAVEKQEADKRQAELETTFRRAILQAIHEAYTGKLSHDHLRIVMKLLMTGDCPTLPTTALPELYPFNTFDAEDVKSHIDGAQPESLELMLLDYAIGDCLTVSSWQVTQANYIEEDETYQGLLELAKLFEIDVAVIRARIFPDVVAAGVDEAGNDAEAKSEPTKKSKGTKKAETAAPAAPNPAADGASPTDQDALTAAWPFPTQKY